MAKEVRAKVLGGEEKTGLEVNKVSDAFAALNLSGNYTATVNGVPKEMDDCLADFAFVSFSTAVKGGM